MNRIDEALIKVALAGVAGVAVAPGVLAADMRPAPFKAPTPVVSWTGWYVGAHAGAAWQNMSQHLDAHDYSSNFTSFIGGGQIGYNWQKGNFVLGFEGDISGLTKKLESRTNDYFASYGGNVSWLSTARLRFGLAVNDTMVYVTGGAAFGSVKFELNEQNGDRFDYKKVRVGWVVGGGIEHMWNRNWTIGMEALFVDLGTPFQNDSAFPGTGLPNGTDERFMHAQQVIGRVKVNYKFN